LEIGNWQLGIEMLPQYDWEYEERKMVVDVVSQENVKFCKKDRQLKKKVLA
jgi:hypothetical protein